jgi:hypothetical protein
MGRLFAARESFRRALALNPRDEIARENLKGVEEVLAKRQN